MPMKLPVAQGGARGGFFVCWRQLRESARAGKGSPLDRLLGGCHAVSRVSGRLSMSPQPRAVGGLGLFRQAVGRIPEAEKGQRARGRGAGGPGGVRKRRATLGEKKAWRGQEGGGKAHKGPNPRDLQCAGPPRAEGAAEGGGSGALRWGVWLSLSCRGLLLLVALGVICLCHLGSEELSPPLRRLASLRAATAAA